MPMAAYRFPFAKLEFCGLSRGPATDARGIFSIARHKCALHARTAQPFVRRIILAIFHYFSSLRVTRRVCIYLLWQQLSAQ